MPKIKQSRPFNFEHAIKGAPLTLRQALIREDGDTITVRLIAHDIKHENYPVVAVITRQSTGGEIYEEVESFTPDGRYHSSVDEPNEWDLIMSPIAIITGRAAFAGDHLEVRMNNGWQPYTVYPADRLQEAIDAGSIRWPVVTREIWQARMVTDRDSGLSYMHGLVFDNSASCHKHFQTEPRFVCAELVSKTQG